MKHVYGRVTRGKGNATSNFQHVEDKIAKRVGLPTLVKGTLNLQLEDHVPITAVTALITVKEYDHEEECIKLRRCRVCRKDNLNNGLRAVIIRPSQHEDPGRPHWKRCELMSNHHLRQKLNLVDCNQLRVTFEEERERDEQWWNAPEPENM